MPGSVEQVKVEDREQTMSNDLPVASRTRRLSSASSQRLNLTRDDETAKVCDATSNAASKEPSVKRMAEILKKPAGERTSEEEQLLVTFEYLVKEAEDYQRAKQDKKMLKQRLLEIEESLESIQAKTDILVDLIKQSQHVVIYTGAGISTSASIPDYRGPNGLWTQIKKTGTFSITKVLDLSQAEPTYTHMAIKELSRRRIVNHVVSQNCDGLHLRSGIAQSNLSEIHGNMYIEVCVTCERQYYRDADVTQQTSRFRHKTGRFCHTCAEPNNHLVDTIVLYGERSRSKWPMNWERASKAAERADLIICMGSSLKTLRRYGCLWPKKSKSTTVKLVIINLQHTPKDKNAILKINGKCDHVMEVLMQKMNIRVPTYSWTSDPLLSLAVPFTQEERVSLKRNSIFELKRYNQLRESLSSPEQAREPASPGALSPTLAATKRRSPIHDENRDSPSMFVSELTGDPNNQRLRMRIRAVNVGATGSSETPEPNDTKQADPELLADCDLANDKDNNQDTHAREVGTKKLKQETDLYNLENLSNLEAKLNYPRQFEYAPPGWLGKSLGASRSSVYRRKRHGNKGRKRAGAASTS